MADEQLLSLFPLHDEEEINIYDEPLYESRPFALYLLHGSDTMCDNIRLGTWDTANTCLPLPEHHKAEKELIADMKEPHNAEIIINQLRRTTSDRGFEESRLWKEPLTHFLSTYYMVERQSILHLHDGGVQHQKESQTSNKLAVPFKSYGNFNALTNKLVQLHPRIDKLAVIPPGDSTLPLVLGVNDHILLLELTKMKVARLPSLSTASGYLHFAPNLRWLILQRVGGVHDAVPFSDAGFTIDTTPASLFVLFILELCNSALSEAAVKRLFGLIGPMLHTVKIVSNNEDNNDDTTDDPGCSIGSVPCDGLPECTDRAYIEALLPWKDALAKLTLTRNRPTRSTPDACRDREREQLAPGEDSLLRQFSCLEDLEINTRLFTSLANEDSLALGLPQSLKSLTMHGAGFGAALKGLVKAMVRGAFPDLKEIRMTTRERPLDVEIQGPRKYEKYGHMLVPRAGGGQRGVHLHIHYAECYLPLGMDGSPYFEEEFPLSCTGKAAKVVGNETD